MLGLNLGRLTLTEVPCDFCLGIHLRMLLQYFAIDYNFPIQNLSFSPLSLSRLFSLCS